MGVLFSKGGYEMSFILFAILITWTIVLLLWTVSVSRSKRDGNQDFVKDLIELKIELRNLREYQQKIEEERAQRLIDTIGNIHKLFEQLKSQSEMSDQEKEKRIQHLIDQIYMFVNQQQKHMETFLLEQGKNKEEIEKRRDAQLSDMKRLIEQFVKTVSGTKTRGQVGEILLKEVLKDSIRVGLVKTNLKVESGEVEFAWDLGDGKYIPIDSKFPELSAIIEGMENSTSVDEREHYRKQIVDRLKKEIERVRKYQNCHNTIDSCIMVVPEVVIELAPELANLALRSGVHVCSYKEVFFVASMIAERYMHLKELGDVGKYKQLLDKAAKIFSDIEVKLSTVEKSISTIQSALQKIRINITKFKSSEDFESPQEQSITGRGG